MDINRDAKTGEFVSEEYADANPETTVTETCPPLKSAWRKEAERLLDVIEQGPDSEDFMRAVVNLQTHCRMLERV